MIDDLYMEGRRRATDAGPRPTEGECECARASPSLSPPAPWMSCLLLAEGSPGYYSPPATARSGRLRCSWRRGAGYRRRDRRVGWSPRPDEDRVSRRLRQHVGFRQQRRFPAGASYRLSTCFGTRSARAGDAALAGLVPPGGRVAALAWGAGRCERRLGRAPEGARAAREGGRAASRVPAGQADRAGARSTPGPGCRAGDVGAAADGGVGALGGGDADRAAPDGGRAVRDPPAARDGGEQRQPARPLGEHLGGGRFRAAARGDARATSTSSSRSCGG